MVLIEFPVPDKCKDNKFLSLLFVISFIRSDKADIIVQLIFQEASISPQGVAALTNSQSLLHHMQSHSLQCIASGGQTPNFKFFFFAQKSEDPSLFLVECIINSSSCKAQLKIKADDESSSKAFSKVFQSALSSYGMS